MSIGKTSELSSVSSSQIVDGAVTSAKIGAGAVVAAGISAGAVGSAALADNAVVAAKIAAGAVGSAALASGAVVAAAIAAGSVGTVAISSGSATSGQILQANGSGAVTFATPAAGGGMTLISSAAVSSGAVITFSSIPGTYKHLRLVVDGYNHASAGWLRMRLNGVTSSAYVYTDTQILNTFTFGYSSFRQSLSFDLHSTAANCTGFLNIYDYATANQRKLTDQAFYFKSSSVNEQYQQFFGVFKSDAGSVTSVEVANGAFPATAGNAGTIYLYGVS